MRSILHHPVRLALVSVALLVVAITIISGLTPDVTPIEDDPRCTEVLRRTVAEAHDMHYWDIYRIETPSFTCVYK